MTQTTTTGISQVWWADVWMSGWLELGVSEWVCGISVWECVGVWV